MSVNVYAHEIFFYVLLAGLRDSHWNAVCMSSYTWYIAYVHWQH